jgi:hypothetical protein
MNRGLQRVLVAIGCAVALALPVSAEGTSTQSTAWCSGSQSWTTARGSVGQPVRLKGRVASVFYARSSRGRPTFIDVGYAYPNLRRVTLVIWGSDRVNFPSPPERMFRRGQVICAQGVPNLYRSVVQIEVGIWDAESRLLSF